MKTKISEALELANAVHHNWINPLSREIWIHGVDVNPNQDYDGEEPGIEYMMATKVIKNLHLLRHMSDDPVTVHLHTCGGVVEEGFAIYDTVRSMPYHVTMISYTHARSASSIVLQAADHRILLPSSYFMFHYGTLYMDGDAKSVYSTLEFSRKQDDRMLDIYVASLKESQMFVGVPEADIRKHIIAQMDKKNDVYLTAEEAVRWGFADEVLDAF